ncbi:unnamed protein product, partial [Ilex paraguariensis]
TLGGNSRYNHLGSLTKEMQARPASKQEERLVGGWISSTIPSPRSTPIFAKMSSLWFPSPRVCRTS